MSFILLEACPPLKQEDWMLQSCQNTGDCCFVEPIYPKDEYGYRCFHGCVKKCYNKKGNPKKIQIPHQNYFTLIWSMCITIIMI